MGKGYERPPTYFKNKKVNKGKCSPGFYSDHTVLHIPSKVYAPLGRDRIREIVEDFFGRDSSESWFSGFESDSNYTITLPHMDHTKSTMYDLIWRIEDAASETSKKKKTAKNRRKVNGKRASRADRLKEIKRIQGSRYH